MNAQVRVDIHLDVAGRPQSVTVAAEQAAVPSETSDLGLVIDQDRISGLPLNQRNFLQLALLSPGVATPVQNSQNSTRGAFAMHVNGAREEYNNFLLDGVDNNDQDVNRYILEPSVDSIQEFKIETNSYSAEYGRNAGGQVNVITRGGSNEVHGFAYEYLRNRVLDASNSFDQGQKAKLIRNQFGAGVGGPVIKDHTFFFASFDALRGRQGFSQFGTVPTVAERQGDLSALGSPVIDPFSGTPFPGNRIPSSSISPLAAKVLALYPLPNLPGLSQNFFSQPVETGILIHNSWGASIIALTIRARSRSATPMGGKTCSSRSRSLQPNCRASAIMSTIPGTTPWSIMFVVLDRTPSTH